MKKYDSYKDSGIEWIGEIPSHWEVKRFGHLFSFSRGLGITKQDLKDEGIPCVNYGEIHSKYGFAVNPEIHPLKCVEESYLETGDKSLLKRGDFIFADTSEDIEGSGNFTVLDSDIPTFAGYHTVIARHENGHNYKYLAYCFDSLEFRNQIRSSVSGIKVFSITHAILKSSKVQLPSYPEQNAIANYLDRKTAEIDQLIADKKSLLELYEEEKTAIINQAVTKGINPNVPMKDSGIEWLGEIPEHWEVKKIGHCGKIVRGGSPRPTGDPRYFFGDYIHWITVKEVTNAVGKYVVGTEEYLTEEGSKNSRIVEPETLLLSNSGATLGVPKISKIRGCINDGSVAFPELKPFLNRDYLYYFFVSHTDIYRQQMAGNGQPNLNTEIIKSTFIPVPSTVEEQIAIVEFIEIEIQKVSAKKAKTEKLIELLTEYRTALISEVVTGKVKVTD